MQTYTHAKVIDHTQHEIDFDAAVMLMDDDLRDQLNDQLAPCSPQEFYDAYVIAHKEKFNQEFFV
jgi:hypothetical protein